MDEAAFEIKHKLLSTERANKSKLSTVRSPFDAAKISRSKCLLHGLLKFLTSHSSRIATASLLKRPFLSRRISDCSGVKEQAIWNQKTKDLTLHIQTWNPSHFLIGLQL